MTVGTIAALRTSVRARSWSDVAPSGPAHGVVCLVTARAWYLSCDGRVVGMLHGPVVGCVPGGVCIEVAALAGRAATAAGAQVIFEGDRWEFRPAVGPRWEVLRGAATSWEHRRGDAASAPAGTAGAGTRYAGSAQDPGRAMAEGMEAALALGGRSDSAARARFVAVLDVLAVPAGDPGAVLDALVGFGPGLTPSGDDLLVGLLALLQARPAVCGPSNASERLRHAVAQRLSATTPFSRYYLEHGLAGRFAAALLDARQALLDPAVGGDHARAFGALVSVGATSGADLLTGMVEPLTHLAVNPGSCSANDTDWYVRTTGGAR